MADHGTPYGIRARGNADLHERRGVRLARVLAGLTVALLPLGPLTTIEIEGGSFAILPSYLLAVALILHSSLSAVQQRTAAGRHVERHTSPARFLLLAAALLFLPVLVADSVNSAALAYLNFSLGTVAGYAVGRAWISGHRQRLNTVDAGLAVFITVGAGQLLGGMSGAASVVELHQSSQTTWGGSNYVAGSLIVASLFLLARLRNAAVQHPLPYALVLFAVAMSLLTYSRGAVLALGAGAVVFFWNAGRTQGMRFLLRLAMLGVPAAVYVLIERVSAVRSGQNQQAAVNVDARFTLFRLGWEEFIGNPLLGTGWVSLREVSAPLFGAGHSFAHNVFISFLQIGGALGAVYLVILAVLVASSLKTGNVMSGAIAAAVAISMTDPFFEGYVGAIIGVSALVVCLHRETLREGHREYAER